MEIPLRERKSLFHISQKSVNRLTHTDVTDIWKYSRYHIICNDGRDNNDGYNNN